MNPQEAKRWEDTMKIVDGLFRRCLQAEAWNITLYERLALLEASLSGKSASGLRRELQERQKHYYQKLMERLENRDPQAAAEIDTRKPEDLL